MTDALADILQLGAVDDSQLAQRFAERYGEDLGRTFLEGWYIQNVLRFRTGVGYDTEAFLMDAAEELRSRADQLEECSRATQGAFGRAAIAAQMNAAVWESPGRESL